LTLDLLLVGFGNVGRRFAALLDERRSQLSHDYGVAMRIVGIATRHGRAYSTRGLDAKSFGERLQRDARIEARASTIEFLGDALERSAAAASEGRLVVVETTTLDIKAGEPAVSHVLAALSGGAHVVTANKGPAACAYQTLACAADRAKRRFLFEGAVMDGIPIFNLARDTPRRRPDAPRRRDGKSAAKGKRVRYRVGLGGGRIMVEMQAMGVAEADASLDVDGWDAAAKTAALANVLMHASLTPQRVERCGITPDLMTRVMEARRTGRRLKLVARAGYEGARIAARVVPEELPADDLLATVDGQQNALILHTDLLGEIAIVQRGSGLTQTAYALVSDLLTIAAELRSARATPPPRPKAPRRRTR
jgi:homoserine dehydrogenase